MQDDRDSLDLKALDPLADATRLERVAAAVATRVAPSLRARRERGSQVWFELAHWRAPVLAAASVIAVAALTVLVLPSRSQRSSTTIASATAATGTTTLAEAAGVPGGVADWLEGSTTTAANANGATR